MDRKEWMDYKYVPNTKYLKIKLMDASREMGI